MRRSLRRELRGGDNQRADVPRVRRKDLDVGDVVYITADYHWHDGFCHVIKKLTPEIGSYNFACKPDVAHARCTLAKTIAQVPTCLKCMAAR